jgi:hypothetical protein
MNTTAALKEVICNGLVSGIEKPDEVFIFSSPQEEKYYFQIDGYHKDEPDLNKDVAYTISHIKYLMKAKGYSLISDGSYKNELTLIFIKHIIGAGLSCMPEHIGDSITLLGKLSKDSSKD